MVTLNSYAPLQLIKEPIVKLSRHWSLLARAASVPPMILPPNATAMTPMTYAQVIPLLRSPRFVLSPESAKYSGRSRTDTRSSTFSVTLIANPPSWGQINPTRKATGQRQFNSFECQESYARLTSENSMNTNNLCEP